MGKQWQSKQEEILHRLSRRSFGAHYIFKPDKWGPAHATKEPCDLVWATRDCVFLIFMTTKKSFPKAEAHNLKQAKGGLKRWRGGQNITGTGGHSNHVKFDLSASAFRHVVILSVVESSATVALVDKQKSAELAVTVYAVIPQKSLEALANAGGSAVDLLSNIAMLAITGPYDEETYLALCSYYAWECVKEAGANGIWKDFRDPEFKRRISMLSGLMELKPVVKNQTPELFLLDDIGMLDKFRILQRFSELETINQRQTRPDLGMLSTSARPLARYAVLLIYGAIWTDKKGVDAYKSLLDYWAKLGEKGLRAKSVVISYDSKVRLPAIVMEPISSPSYLQSLLNTVPEWRSNNQTPNHVRELLSEVIARRPPDLILKRA